MTSEPMTLDELIELAGVPVDVVAIAAGVRTIDVTNAIMRATLTYLLDIGAIEAQPRDRLPDLLPMRVGQPPASLSGDLRGLLADDETEAP